MWQGGEADRLGGQRVAAALEGGSGRGNQRHEQDEISQGNTILIRFTSRDPDQSQ